MSVSDTMEGETRTLRLENQLCFALYAATNAVTRKYRPRLGALGLTYPQFLVMISLWQHGTRSVTQIAEHLKVGANAVTPLVDQLVRARLVTREPVESDRRRVAVTLTKAGRALEEPAARASDEVDALGGLSAAETDALRATLHEITARLEAHSD